MRTEHEPVPAAQGAGAGTAGRTRARLTRRGRLLVGVLALLGLQALGLGAFELVSTPGASGVLAAAPAGAPAPSDGPFIVPRQTTTESPILPMATVGGLTIQVPGASVVAVAYHEAALRAALALQPAGRCIRNVNSTKFVKPPATPGPDYLVMSSRGRPHPATSAVDVAMREGERVLAPVSGTVTSVKRYFLYGRYPDYRVAIKPTARPNLRVVMIHLDRLKVRLGSRVLAGGTVIGTPRIFPFGSQVNNYIGPGIPHVHLEVKEHGA